MACFGIAAEDARHRTRLLGRPASRGARQPGDLFSTRSGAGSQTKDVAAVRDFRQRVRGARAPRTPIRPAVLKAVHASAHADPPALIRVIEDADSTIGSAPGLSAFNDRLRDRGGRGRVPGPVRDALRRGLPTTP